VLTWAALGLVLGSFTATARAEPPATTQGATTKEKDKDKDTVAVKKATITIGVDADGYFEPIEPFDVRIRPEQYAGELKIVSAAAQGATVKSGDKLIEFDTEEIARQIAAAENELASAKAAATKADADAKLGEQSDALALKMAQTELANSEGSLKWFDDVDGKQMLQSADLSIKRAKDNVEDQNDELDQLKKMYKSEELTSATADIVVKRALRSLDQAKIMLEMTEARSSKTKEFEFPKSRQGYLFGVDGKKQELEKLKAQLEQSKVARQSAVFAAKQALDKAERKLKDLKDDREKLTVKAPSDGVLLYGQLVNGGWQNANPRSLRVGEKSAPNQVLMTLFTPGRLRLKMELSETKAGQVKQGLPAWIVPLALPEAAVKGTTAAFTPIGVMRDNNQFIPAPVDLGGADSHLLPGQRASVHVDAGEARDVLTLPAAAVSRGRVRMKASGGDGKDVWREIVTGASDGELVEIKSGLNAGEEVYAKAGK
jgi:HlyD family secretion protein